MSLNTSSSAVPFPLGLHNTHPGVTRLGLPTSGTDEIIREEGNATYTYTLFINGSTATLTN